jgi:hypothetical protein
MDAWRACLRNAARQYDDHTSDAGSVAIGIKARCHTYHMAIVEAYTRGMNYQARTMMEDRVAASDDELGIATQVVLMERRQ